MSISARFVSTPYPPEVDDLLAASSVSPNVAAVAGYFLVSTDAPRAVLFAVASDIDCISVPLQPLPSRNPPQLALWRNSEHSICAAALTEDGVLRVYRNIDVKRPRLRCEELRVGSFLGENGGGTLIYYPPAHELYIFAVDGAAIVSFRDSRLAARPLKGSQPSAASTRIGSLFYSAIQSIGMDSGRQSRAERLKIIGHGIVDRAIMIIRAGGDVERWSPAGKVWSFNVPDVLAKSEMAEVVSGGVTSDGTVVLLTTGTDDEDEVTSFACFDVRFDEAPKEAWNTTFLYKSSVPKTVLLVISGDIVYFYEQDSRNVAWTSVARGVAAESQVFGSATLENQFSMYAVVDASFGIDESMEKGGIAACLHSSGVSLGSCHVPAPVSVDTYQDSSAAFGAVECKVILRRAFRQYESGQKGAAKACLRTLVDGVASSEFHLDEILGTVIEHLSRKIINLDGAPDKAPTLLLIDNDLEKKKEQHTRLMQMISDKKLFAQLRSDAPSYSEDRIWDAIMASSRAAVLRNSEKLAAAAKVRDIHNGQLAYVNQFNPSAANQGFDGGMADNEGDVTNIPNNNQNGQDGEKRSNVVTDALSRAGKSLTRRSRSVEELSCLLYHYPSEFHQFLPALVQSISHVLKRVESDYNVTRGEADNEMGSYGRSIHSVIVPACEAAAAVVQGAREAREENKRLIAYRNEMESIGIWVCESANRRFLSNIAETAFKFAARTSRDVREQIYTFAAPVVEELAACSFMTAELHLSSKRETSVSGSHKRRRVDLKQYSNEFMRELQWCLELLCSNGLSENAFQLAEKYGDYNSMMMLRVSSASFDEFMETSLEKLGDGFGASAFHWLEERGKIHLLLKGRKKKSDWVTGGIASQRSRHMTALLAKYFDKNSRGLTNLSWMHSLLIGDYPNSVRALLQQAEKVSQPERPGSVNDGKLICSIAKLALRAADDTDDSISTSRDSERAMDTVMQRLQLIDIQKIIEPNCATLADAEVLIQKIMNEGSAVDEGFHERIIIALEVLIASKELGYLGEKAGAMEDFIWRRSVERQADLFETIALQSHNCSDIEMRELLMSTAVYKAAARAAATEASMKAVIERGAFQNSLFEEKGCLPQVTRLVQTAVCLAVS